MLHRPVKIEMFVWKIGKSNPLTTDRSQPELIQSMRWCLDHHMLDTILPRTSKIFLKIPMWQRCKLGEIIDSPLSDIDTDRWENSYRHSTTLHDMIQQLARRRLPIGSGNPITVQSPSRKAKRDICSQCLTPHVQSIEHISSDSMSFHGVIMLI